MNQNSFVKMIDGLLLELGMGKYLAGTLASVAVVLIAGLLTVAAVRLNNVIFRKVLRKKDLRLRYMKNFLDLLIIVCGMLLLGIFFGNSRELGRILLGGSGLIVAIIGFAAQSALGDVAAGFMMGVCKPFQLGDRITLESSGISGTVRDMTVRHTLIHRFDGLYVVVPNSVINKEIIHNTSYSGELTGSYLFFDISYDSDVEKAMRIIHNAVISCRFVVETAGDNPEHKRAAVYITDFTDSSVQLRTTIWARNSDENFLACSSIRLKVKKEFERQGIEIPYNFMNVVVRDEEEAVAVLSQARKKRERLAAEKAAVEKAAAEKPAAEADGEVAEPKAEKAGPAKEKAEKAKQPAASAAPAETAGQEAEKNSQKPEEEELTEEEKRFGRFMKKVETFSRRYSLSTRETSQLRLLSEEMYGLLSPYAGGSDITSSLRMKGQICEVRLKMDAELSADVRRELLRMSSSGGNILRKNMVEFLQDVVRDYRRGNDDLRSGRWSLRQYEKSLLEDDTALDEEKDEFQRSIISRLADDVQIGVREGKVEIVAYKKLWTAAV